MPGINSPPGPPVPTQQNSPAGNNGTPLAKKTRDAPCTCTAKASLLNKNVEFSTLGFG